VGRGRLPILLAVFVAGCQPGARAERDSAVATPTSVLPTGAPAILSSVGAGPPVSPAQTPVVADSPMASGVLGAVPAGRGAWSVAVSEPLRRAYVTNREEDTVTVVDLVANQVVATLPMGSDPHNVAVDETANRVYVTLHGGAERGDAVAVLDAADGRLLATWATGPFPAALALNPVAGRLYVQNEGDNTLTVLDTRSGAEMGRVSMPGILTDVAVSSGSGRVYAPNWITNTLVTLDGQNHSVVGQAAIGPMPWRVAVNPRTERVYVADGTSPGADQGSLYTVEGWDGAVQGRALGAVPLGVAVDPATQEVLVTDARLGTLSVLDENGQQVRWQGVVGPAPHTVVPARGLGRAYVILSGQDALAVLEWPPRDRSGP
jgi:YVTN family beta-propeller protein